MQTEAEISSWHVCGQVSRRVSELVLENHPAYAAELERVMELERSLQDANDICATGRQYVECFFLSLCPSVE